MPLVIILFIIISYYQKKRNKNILCNPLLIIFKLNKKYTAIVLQVNVESIFFILEINCCIESSMRIGNTADCISSIHSCCIRQGNTVGMVSQLIFAVKIYKTWQAFVYYYNITNKFKNINTGCLIQDCKNLYLKIFSRGICSF